VLTDKGEYAPGGPVSSTLTIIKACPMGTSAQDVGASSSAQCNGRWRLTSADSFGTIVRNHGKERRTIMAMWRLYKRAVTV
jgi:hypothetical protein